VTPAPPATQALAVKAEPEPAPTDHRPVRVLWDPKPSKPAMNHPCPAAGNVPGGNHALPDRSRTFYNVCQGKDRASLGPRF
jgi:hypothetical protein